MSSILKILVDSNCEVYCDFELKGEASPESLFRLNLKKGVYILDFKRDNEILSTINYTMQTNDEEDLLKVNLIEIIKENEREKNFNQIQSKNVQIHTEYENGIVKFYIIDQETSNTIEIPFLVSARNFYDDYFAQLAPTFDKCGLVTISNGGEIEYYHTSEYYNIKNGKFGCINKSGYVQIKPIYDNEIYFLNQHVTVGKIGNKSYFINKWGEEAFENSYEKVSNFILERCIVFKNNKCGVINCFGKIIIPIIYDELYVDYNAIRVKQGNKWGLLDFDGNSILPILYDIIVPKEKLYLENCWFDFNMIHSIECNNQYFKDNSGKMCIYKVENNNKLGFIDNTGFIHTPVECIRIPMRDSDVVYYNGKYRVLGCREPQYDNGKYHHVLGHTEPQYDAIYTSWGDEVGNYNGELSISNAYFVNYEGSLLNCYKFWNLKELLDNKYVLNFRCDSFDSDIKILNGKKGVIGKNECMYDEIDKIDFGYKNIYKVLNDGLYGLLDEHGEEIIPCQYRFFKHKKLDGFFNNDLSFTFDNNEAIYRYETKELQYIKKPEHKYLFFDTETIGLPVNWDAPLTDLNNWPRMVQIAWILCDDQGQIIESENSIIKPDDFTIPIECSKIHRITTENAKNNGQNIESALHEFNRVLDVSDFIVAHNIKFDENILGAEFIRKKIKTKLHEKNKLCTMQSSVDYCKLSGNNGHKWPKLSELYFKLFGEEFNDAHNAFADITATVKCFWKMREIGLL